MKHADDTLLYHILIDEDFIHYVIEPTAQLSQKWEHYIETHPEHIPTLTLAKSIISGQDESFQLSVSERNKLEMDIVEACGINHFN